jgi:L-methionine (R)-S-oxide reductase
MTNQAKQELYEQLLIEADAVIDSNISWIGNAANLCALINIKFKHWWCGIYYVNSNNKLELGPFVGPIACTLIGYGKGVCGTAWKEQKTIIVPDVHQFEGHIACSAASNSEIVVPIFKSKTTVAVLDIDSVEFNTFDETDQFYLEQLVKRLQF